MKHLLPISVILLLFVSSPARAQLSAEDTLFFQNYEDTINQLCDTMFNSSSEKVRMKASQKIIGTLKRSLLRENSYFYDFSGLTAISLVTPRDSTFRIFTWQLIFDNNTYRYFGAIQLNQPQLELYPLVDYSVVMEPRSTRVTDNERWIGALYYDIVKVNDGERDYYTVFGYDGNNAFSTIKVADVLWFSDTGSIHFGAPIFQYSEEPMKYRHLMEYKKGISAGISYSAEHDMILLDHLIPLNEASEGMYLNYVPDGSYSGFKWEEDRWVFVDKVFDFKLKDGEFPDGN